MCAYVLEYQYLSMPLLEELNILGVPEGYDSCLGVKKVEEVIVLLRPISSKEPILG